MTALKQYSRLESTASWQKNQSEEQRRVLISVGKTSLIISNFDDEPITHWSLNSIKLVDYNNGEAVFSPNIGDQEKLFIRDTEMIASLQLFIETKKRSRRKNPLFIVMPAIAFLIIIITLFPLAEIKLRQLTLSVISETHEAQIAQNMLQKHLSLSGPVCQSAQSDQILKSLVNLAGTDRVKLKLIIVQNQSYDVIHLPAGLLLLSEEFLRELNGPGKIFTLISEESKTYSNRGPLKKLVSDQSLSDISTFLLGLSRELAPPKTDNFIVDTAFISSNSKHFMSDFTWVTLTNSCLS